MLLFQIEHKDNVACVQFANMEILDQKDPWMDHVHKLFTCRLCCVFFFFERNRCRYFQSILFPWWHCCFVWQKSAQNLALNIGLQWMLFRVMPKLIVYLIPNTSQEGKKKENCRQHSEYSWQTDQPSENLYEVMLLYRSYLSNSIQQYLGK